jgi:hypothetical protein
MGDKWISVKDQLPDNGTPVLICHHQDLWVCCGERDGRQWFNQFDDSGVPCYPTHWMPLPEPPVIEKLLKEDKTNG